MNYWILEGNYLVFQANGYEVPLQYIFTQERLDLWVQCLSEKRWTTPEIIEEFIAISETWMAYHNWPSAANSVCHCLHCDLSNTPKSAEFQLGTIHDPSRHLSEPHVILPDADEQFQPVL
ncbi:MAG: hypothetical protein AB3A66_29830 (plasmid) [Nodularia sp. CChRGM 3473]